MWGCLPAGTGRGRSYTFIWEKSQEMAGGGKGKRTKGWGKNWYFKGIAFSQQGDARLMCMPVNEDDLRAA